MDIIRIKDMALYHHLDGYGCMVMNHDQDCQYQCACMHKQVCVYMDTYKGID